MMFPGARCRVVFIAHSLSAENGAKGRFEMGGRGWLIPTIHTTMGASCHCPWLVAMVALRPCRRPAQRRGVGIMRASTAWLCPKCPLRGQTRSQRDHVHLGDGRAECRGRHGRAATMPPPAQRRAAESFASPRIGRASGARYAGRHGRSATMATSEFCTLAGQTKDGVQMPHTLLPQVLR